MNLIILNGWSSSESIWDSFIEAVSPRNYRIISTYEIFGEDKYHKEPERVVNELINEYMSGIEGEYYLVGWSLGGMLAIKSYPILTIKPKGLLVISAPVEPDVEKSRQLSESLKKDAHGTLGRFMSMAMTIEEKKELMSQHVNLSSGNTYVNDIGENEIRALVRGRAYLERGLCEDDVKRIDCKCSWIHGDKDRICSFEKAEKLVVNVENCSFHRMEKAGHVPFVTCGEKVRQFLKVL